MNQHVTCVFASYNWLQWFSSSSLFLRIKASIVVDRDNISASLSFNCNIINIVLHAICSYRSEEHILDYQLNAHIPKYKPDQIQFVQHKMVAGHIPNSQDSLLDPPLQFQPLRVFDFLFAIFWFLVDFSKQRKKKFIYLLAYLHACIHTVVVITPL